MDLLALRAVTLGHPAPLLIMLLGNARALRKLRSQLGEDVFTAEALQVLDAESVTTLKELLDQLDKPGEPPG